MTRLEFAGVMAYLASAVGKPVAESTAEVYYDLLGDLPLAAVQYAAKAAVLEHRFATLPPVGRLREAALELLHGREPAALEAWGLVRRAVRRYGHTGGSRAIQTLPVLAREAVASLGWGWLCDCDSEGVAQARFLEAYRVLLERSGRERLLPPALRALAESVAEGARSGVLALPERG